jgi:hypothetical protein
MCIDYRIDDMIEAGWGVVDSDFDPVAFQRWKQKAYDCLSAMVGPDHVYTKHFAEFVTNCGKADVLAASGILSAAKEHLSCSQEATDGTPSQEDAISPN